MKTGEMTFLLSLDLDDFPTVNSESAESEIPLQSPVKSPATPTGLKEEQFKRSRCGRLIKPPSFHHKKNVDIWIDVQRVSLLFV